MLGLTHHGEQTILLVIVNLDRQWIAINFARLNHDELCQQELGKDLALLIADTKGVRALPG